MVPTTDPDLDVAYLRDVQYRNTTELAKRANLHVAYRRAPQAGFDWFAELVDWPAGGMVLDVGCGGGYLWPHVAAACPAGIRLTLSDLSPGMVEEATATARSTEVFADVEGQAADARALPFDDGTFDVVVSTYALYHVPSPADAVAEIARVVKPGGTVAIMTNGPGHLTEIAQLRAEVFGEAGRYHINEVFSPAVAASMLIDHFDEVSWHRYSDELLVTDANDLMAFATSSPPADQATDEQLVSMLATVEREIERHGFFRVSKDTGALICRLLPAT